MLLHIVICHRIAICLFVSLSVGLGYIRVFIETAKNIVLFFPFTFNNIPVFLVFSVLK